MKRNTLDVLHLKAFYQTSEDCFEGFPFASSWECWKIIKTDKNHKGLLSYKKSKNRKAQRKTHVKSNMENTLGCNLGLNNEQATQCQDSVQIKLGFANNSNFLTTCNPLHEVQSNFWQPLWPLPALWPSHRSLEDNQKSTVTNKKRRASKPISFELVRLFY